MKFEILINFNQVNYLGLKAIDLCRKFNIPVKNEFRIKEYKQKFLFDEDLARKMPTWFDSTNFYLLYIDLNDIIKIKPYRNTNYYTIDLSDKEIKVLILKKYNEYVQNMDDIDE